MMEDCDEKRETAGRAWGEGRGGRNVIELKRFRLKMMVFVWLHELPGPLRYRKKFSLSGRSKGRFWADRIILQCHHSE